MATNTSVWAAENPNVNPSPSSGALQLTSDTALSREGYFVLSWPASSRFEALQLEQSSSADFSTASSKPVRGIDSLTITGLLDGDYYYRLVAYDSVVSNALTVRVEHHALGRALSFFLLGFLVFVVLLGAIFHGHRRQGGENG